MFPQSPAAWQIDLPQYAAADIKRAARGSAGMMNQRIQDQRNFTNGTLEHMPLEGSVMVDDSPGNGGTDDFTSLQTTQSLTLDLTRGFGALHEQGDVCFIVNLPDKLLPGDRKSWGKGMLGMTNMTSERIMAVQAVNTWFKTYFSAVESGKIKQLTAYEVLVYFKFYGKLEYVAHGKLHREGTFIVQNEAKMYNYWEASVNHVPPRQGYTAYFVLAEILDNQNRGTGCWRFEPFVGDQSDPSRSKHYAGRDVYPICVGKIAYCGSQFEPMYNPVRRSAAEKLLYHFDPQDKKSYWESARMIGFIQIIIDNHPRV